MSYFCLNLLVRTKKYHTPFEKAFVAKSLIVPIFGTLGSWKLRTSDQMMKSRDHRPCRAKALLAQPPAAQLSQAWHRRGIRTSSARRCCPADRIAQNNAADRCRLLQHILTSKKDTANIPYAIQNRTEPVLAHGNLY